MAKGKQSNNALEIWRLNGGRSWNTGLKLPYNPHLKQRGFIPWNKGKAKLKIVSCAICNEEFSFTAHQASTRKFCSRKCWQKSVTGLGNWKWKGGIKLRDKHSWQNPEYVKWRTSIFKRDNWKCKISNKDCNGQLEAHHILSWAEYPELRYIINNGITLCHAHHPRGREKEKRLAPVLQALVSASN